MKLLLVDDEPGIREGLAALLRRKGHEVATAGDGARASELLAAGEFDAVLTDWRLPDGPASRFLGRCGCPVVAMSGHPEEVEHHTLRAVLQKPVTPSTLLTTLADLAAPVSEAAETALPVDVAALVAAAERLLGPLTVVDDGAFVRVHAPLPGEDALLALADLGGDHRVLSRGGRAFVEILWCRDGRPDPTLPVVAPAAGWPDAPEFAVDFHGAELAPPAFGACIERATAARARGRTVHFLNVPASLLSWATSHGKAHDMPMKATVGPRLPAVLADLWS